MLRVLTQRDGEAGDIGAFARRSNRHADVAASTAQPLDQMAADETGAARDEHFLAFGAGARMPHGSRPPVMIIRPFDQRDGLLGVGRIRDARRLPGDCCLEIPEHLAKAAARIVPIGTKTATLK